MCAPLLEDLCKSWTVFSWSLKLPSLRGRGTWLPNPYMTVPFHSPPTRGPVMNFCTSRTRGGEKKSRSVAAVSPRLTCILQNCLASGVPSTTRIMQCVRHGVRSDQSATSCTKGRSRIGTPLDQSEQCSERVYTQRHMARLRCPCEPDMALQTVLLCQM